MSALGDDLLTTYLNDSLAIKQMYSFYLNPIVVNQLYVLVSEVF